MVTTRGYVRDKHKRKFDRETTLVIVDDVNDLHLFRFDDQAC